MPLLTPQKRHLKAAGKSKSKEARRNLDEELAVKTESEVASLCQAVLQLGRRSVKETIRTLAASLYNDDDSHLPALTDLLLGKSRRSLGELKDGKQIKQVLDVHHKIGERLSGGDEVTLFQTRLKSDVHFCKKVLDDSFLRELARGHEFLKALPILRQISPKCEHSEPTHPANISCAPASGERLWSDIESEHMFIHMGGAGLSEEEYKYLEHALRDENNMSRICTLDVLKQNLGRFKKLIEATQGESKGYRVSDSEKLVWDRLKFINENEMLNLPLQSTEIQNIRIVLGEGGDTFGDSKGIVQDMKVFAVRAAIRRIEYPKGTTVWEDPAPQADQNRIPLAVISDRENANILASDIAPISKDFEQWSKEGLNGVDVVRKLEGDKKYKRLCINRLSNKYICDFCCCSIDQVHNLQHEWGLEITLEDLKEWGRDGLLGQSGPPVIEYDPSTQLTTERVHAKLRIIGGKCIDLLYEEAHELDAETLRQSFYSEFDERMGNRETIDKHMEYVEAQHNKELQNFIQEQETLIKCHSETDSTNSIKKKLYAAQEYFEFQIPEHDNVTDPQSADDASDFILYKEQPHSQSCKERRPKQFQCTICKKAYAKKSGAIKHVSSVHGKCQPLSAKEMKKKQLESVENNKKEMDELMTIVKMCVQKKCDSYDNPKVKLKEGVNKTNLKQLELQFVAIDKNANECGLASDAKTSFRQKLASKQKEAKHKINLEATQFMEDLVKLETPKKDSQGKKRGGNYPTTEEQRKKDSS